MVTMFIRHKVADYGAWRQVYDAVAPMQRRLGVQAQTVFQAVDDPRDVTVTHEFASADAAHAFAASPDLREAMGSAGVEGHPTIWFASPA